MSLINEALKRAEAEKGPANPFAATRLPSATPTEPVTGAEEAKQPAGPADDRSGLDARPARSSCQGRSALLMGLLLLAALAAAAYFAMHSRHTPQQAKAALPAVATARMMPVAAAKGPAADAVQPAGGETAAAVTMPPPVAKPASGEIALEAKLEPEPAPAGTATAAPDPVAGGVEAAAQPALVTEKSKQPYRLSAILQSSDGGRALINNQLVGVGDEVDKATVMKIDPAQVLLQKDGAQIILRL